MVESLAEQPNNIIRRNKQFNNVKILRVVRIFSKKAKGKSESGAESERGKLKPLNLASEKFLTKFIYTGNVLIMHAYENVYTNNSSMFLLVAAFVFPLVRYAVVSLASYIQITLCFLFTPPPLICPVQCANNQFVEEWKDSQNHTNAHILYTALYIYLCVIQKRYWVSFHCHYSVILPVLRYGAVEATNRPAFCSWLIKTNNTTVYTERGREREEQENCQNSKLNINLRK